MAALTPTRDQPGSKRMKSRVLVIDDDDVVRQRICSELQREGYQVFDLPSPIGATRALMEQAIDVVVIDVVMPSISGDRLARLFRGNPRLKRLGVVLMSGDGTVKLQSLADEVGADAVVDKAKIREALGSAVATALRTRAPSQEAGSDGTGS